MLIPISQENVEIVSGCLFERQCVIYDLEKWPQIKGKSIVQP